MSVKTGIQSGPLACQGTEPNSIDLRAHELFFEGLTEVTVKFETPEARQAREHKEADESHRKHKIEILKLIIASIVLLGFLGLSFYLLAFKPDASQQGKIFSLVGTVVFGSAVFIFGGKSTKSD